MEKDTLNNQLYHATKILELLFKADLIVRNEVYMLLIKQIHNNHSRSLLFYLQLTVLVSSFISPT